MTLLGMMFCTIRELVHQPAILHKQKETIVPKNLSLRFVMHPRMTFK